MLATPSDAHVDDLPFTSFLVLSAMGGVMRGILEGGESPRKVRPLRRQLSLAVPRLPDECRGRSLKGPRASRPLRQSLPVVARPKSGACREPDRETAPTR
jgi:hypothetical protein